MRFRLPDSKTALALAAWVSCLLPSHARAAAFRDWVKVCTAPPADPAEAAGPRAFTAAAEWGGRLFLQSDARTYWTADSGRTWESRGWIRDTPKGPAPALEGGWFTATRRALYLGNRSGAIAYAFGAAGGGWTAFPPGQGTMAAGGDGDRLYAYTAGGGLKTSGDGGAGWGQVTLPDSIRIGSYFDDVQAQGPRLLLSNRDVTSADRPAASLDGGATWMRWPARTAVALSQGCVNGFLRGDLDTWCVPNLARSQSDAPFETAQRLFADRQGTLFAWADSALYACRPAEREWRWALLASREALRGWTLRRDFLYRLRADSLEWLSLEPGPAAGLRAVQSRPSSVPGRSRSWPAWLQSGRRPDGRALGGPVPDARATSGP